MTDEEKILAKFNRTPLRWYPSGKKVFTLRFKLTVALTMMKYRIRHFVWKIKNGYI